jgi:hypothetical protein
VTGDAVIFNERALRRSVHNVGALSLRRCTGVVNGSDAGDEYQAQLQTPFFHLAFLLNDSASAVNLEKALGI